MRGAGAGALVALLIALVAGGMLSGSRNAGAAFTFQVNDTADSNSAAAVAACFAVGPGCTLRAAITAANGSVGVDIITIPPGDYVLSVAGVGEDANVTGDLDILDDLTIFGDAVTNPVISANGIDRVFDLANADVRANNITVGGGLVAAGGGGGGGIRAVDSTLRLQGLLVDSNSTGAASGGGGILVEAGPLGIAGLTITESTISNNGTPGGGLGAGIRAQDATVEISSTTIELNNAGAGGLGGGLSMSNSVASLTGVLVDSNVVGGTACGGGIHADQTALTIDSITVTGNSAGLNSSGSGLCLSGSTAAITGAVVTGNTMLAGGSGSGLYASAVTLGIGDSDFSGNTGGDAVKGGGIAVEGATALTVTGSTITGNTLGAGASSGAGIYAGTGPMLDISGTVITGNTAGDDASGGGIYTEADLVLTGVTVNANSVGENGLGGGIAIMTAIGAGANIYSSTIGGNSGGDFALGGGIYTERATLIQDSAISGNSTAFEGGGSGIYNGAQLQLYSSTVSDNTGGDDTYGGGIYTGLHAILGNVTVSGNTIGGINGFGAGIDVDGGSLTANNVTITDNALAAGSVGGGLYQRFGTSATLQNTIIADQASGTDCAGTGTVTSEYSLDSDGTCPLAGTGDISAGNANLEPLAHNGGPTRTHALGSGSQAAEAGSPEAPGSGTPGSCMGVDQRGVLRPQGARCDIGAFEADDSDGDGVTDGADLCPSSPSLPVDANGCTDGQVDPDGDKVCTPGAPSPGPTGCVGADNCPDDSNADQADGDFDGLGDACDALPPPPSAPPGFTCDGISPALVTSQDFSTFDAGEWYTSGGTVWDAAGGRVFLTNTAPSQNARLYWGQKQSGCGFRAAFTMAIGGGSGGEGMTLAVSPETGYATPAPSGGLDFCPGTGGFAIEFDTVMNAWDAEATQISVLQDCYDNAVNSVTMDASGYHHVTVDFIAGQLTVYFDGVLILEHALAGITALDHFIGFTAATGVLTNNHVVDAFSLSVATSATPTPSPTPTATPAAVTPTPAATSATAPPTGAPTDTAAPTGTPIATAAPTATPVATATPAPTATPEPTRTPTATPVPTSTVTRTPTVAPTQTAAPTSTRTPTATPQITAQPTGAGGTTTTAPTIAPSPSLTPTRNAQQIVGGQAGATTATATPKKSVTPSPARTAAPAGRTAQPSPSGEAPGGTADGGGGGGAEGGASGPLTAAEKARPEPLRALRDPSDISTDPAVIGTNLLLAIIMLAVILVTSNVFNGVIGEKLEDVPEALGGLLAPFRALGGIMPRLEALGATATAIANLTAFAGVLVMNGFIYSFLDPSFGFNTETLVLFLSLVIGVGIVTYLYGGTQALFTRRRFGVPAGIKMFPIALAIALVSVVISRVTEFQPGIVYGFVASYAVLSDAILGQEENGEVVFYPSLVLVGFCLICWMLVIPARDLTGSSDIWMGALPEATLACIFIGGLEGLFFNLFPVNFMEGKYIWDWSKKRWLFLMAISAFLFWHVLINKEGAYDEMLSETSATTAAIVITGSIVLAGGAWLFFKLREEDDGLEAEAEA